MTMAVDEANECLKRVQRYVADHDFLFTKFVRDGAMRLLGPSTVLCLLDTNVQAVRQFAEKMGMPCPTPADRRRQGGLMICPKSVFGGAPFRAALDDERVMLVMLEDGIHLFVSPLGKLS